MRILPPTENTKRITRELSQKPRRPRTSEEVTRQVREHLRQAQEELSRHGHGGPKS